MSSHSSPSLADLKNGLEYIYLDIGYLPYTSDASEMKQIGRIHCALYNKVTPRTCLNVYTTASGLFPRRQAFFNPFTQRKVKNYTYKHLEVDSIIPNAGIMLGSFFGNLDSIYGGPFPDENYNLPHHKPFLLTTTGFGTGYSSSQFMITSAPRPDLDGKCVVFGEVFDRNSQEVLHFIERHGNPTGKSKTAQFRILNCGVVDRHIADELRKFHHDSINGVKDIDVARLALQVYDNMKGVPKKRKSFGP